MIRTYKRQPIYDKSLLWLTFLSSSNAILLCQRSREVTLRTKYVHLVMIKPISYRCYTNKQNQEAIYRIHLPKHIQFISPICFIVSGSYGDLRVMVSKHPSVYTYGHNGVTSLKPAQSCCYCTECDFNVFSWTCIHFESNTFEIWFVSIGQVDNKSVLV